MDDLGVKLNIRDWSELTKDVLITHRGQGLLNHFDGSTSKLLMTVYPQYKNECIEFLNKLALEFKLNKVEDVVTIPKQYQ